MNEKNSIDFTSKIKDERNPNKINYDLDHKLITEIILELLVE